MGEKTAIKISANTAKKIFQLASETGLSTNKLVELLLEAFIEGKGKVYIGKWDEGPGVRVLPDWPRFSSIIFKIKREELQE